MRILHINTFPNGGASNACIRLHQGLINEGVGSELLFAERNRNGIGHNFQQWYQKKDWTLLDRLGRRRLFEKWKKWHQKAQFIAKGYEPFNIPFSIYPVDRHPAVRQADLIHLHWIGNFIDILSFFKNVSQPIVWTLHDLNPALGGMHFRAGYDLEKISWLEDKLISIKKKAVSSHQNVTIAAPSNWLLEEAKQSPALSSARKHICIPYGIDTTVFSPYADREDLRKKMINDYRPGTKYLLMVADRLDNRRKGISFLIQAVKFLEQQSFPIAILLAGKADQVLLEKMPVSTQCFGFVADEKEMNLLYNIADVFVHPAVEDNLPNTVLESLCAGTPVAGFNIGGMPDMVKSGSNGFLARDVDPAQLAEQIKKVIDSQFDNNEIGHNASQFYNLNRQARNYQALYQEISEMP